MKNNIFKIIAVSGLLVLSCSAAGIGETFRIKVDNYSPQQLENLKNQESVKYWSEINDELLVVLKDERSPFYILDGTDVRKVQESNELSEPYWAFRRGADSPLDIYRDQMNVLYEDESRILFQAPAHILEQLERNSDNHFMIKPFTENFELELPAERFLEEKEIPSSVMRNRKQKVDIDRVAGYIKKLEGFRTRYTYTDGYMNSVNWAVEELEKHGYKVVLEEYSDYGRSQYNVVATKGEVNPESGQYIICGHLDSTSNNAQSLAPGADDNGSGSAGVIETAVLLKDESWIGNLRFVLFAGEEVGLKGSKAYVKALKKSGDIEKIKGVVNYDMIGFDRKSPLSALIETHRFADPFIRNFVAAAQNSGALKTSVSFHAWGSDHVPFLNEEVPTFLFIEDEYAANPNYHKTTDTFKDVNMGLVEAIIQTVVDTMPVFF